MHKLDIPVIGATLGLTMLLVLVAGSLASSVPAVTGHVRLAGMPPRTMVAVDPGCIGGRSVRIVHDAGAVSHCSDLRSPSMMGRNSDTTG